MVVLVGSVVDVQVVEEEGGTGVEVVCRDVGLYRVLEKRFRAVEERVVDAEAVERRDNKYGELRNIKAGICIRVYTMYEVYTYIYAVLV